MNKQEKEDLIQALYDIGGCDAEDEWSRGYDDGVNAAIEVVKEIKVQEKAVLPKTADDFIKEGEGIGSDKVDIIDSAISFARAMPNDEFSLWFKSNRNSFVDALANGYEVENEPLYYVDFINDGDVHKRLILDHENGKHNIVDWSENLIGLVQEIFTEQEIKAIDERYWPFAVKVDGEQMKYKTRYSSIVPKGQIGECIDKVDGELLALLIKFGNGEVFWFMKRDLIEVEDK